MPAFLFTDLEGSTGLWEEHPEAMRGALRRHDEILREAIESRGGRVFKTQGDAFWAVFEDAAPAVAAALAAQVGLRPVAISTPQGGRPLKVRMALHAVTSEEIDSDFSGPAVNRAARLLAVGHGGQVLLSSAALEALGGRLPPEAATRDLGEHRLRELAGTGRVFQLVHPDLPGDFPPLRSADNPALKHNLPRAATLFIGREKERGEVRALLEGARLVTLTGPGGAGKTRLALETAADRVASFPGGAWLVELAALVDPALVPAAVAAALRVREEPGRPILATLTEYLTDRRLLLVLDNCEHLLGACGELAHALLREAAGVRILATSREALGVYGETLYPVPSLALPDPAGDPDPAALLRYESVRLFAERATEVCPGFAVTRENARALVSLCRRLDGIPLALELAAARTGTLGVGEIDRGLDERFALPAVGGAAVPRQQTLRSLIDWSYDLLGTQEKALFARLSVFAGGWTLAAAEAVCAGDPLEEWEVLDILAGLTGKSLVSADPSGEITRYRLLETVRAYAVDRLRESGEPDAWRARHLEYFTTLAQEAEAHLGGAEQKAWLERLDQEHDNLRAALDLAHERDPEAGLRMAGALWRFWDLRGHLEEGRNRITALLERAASGRTAARARALHGAGLLAFRQGDPVAARGHYEESLEIGRELGDRPGIAAALNQLGNVAWLQGDYRSARELHEESLRLRKELGDRRGVAASLNNLGNLAMREGDLAAARACLEECLGITREFGDAAGIAISLNNLGNVVRLQNDPGGARVLLEESLRMRRELGDRAGIASSLNNLAMAVSDLGDRLAARALYEESLEIARELGDRRGIAHALGNLSEITCELGDPVSARALYVETLAVFRDLGDPWGIGSVLEGLAGVAVLRGHPLSAARLLGGASRLREEIGAAIPPHERPRYDRQVAEARAAASSPEAFDAAWEEGRSLTLEQATDLGLAQSHASSSLG